MNIDLKEIIDIIKLHPFKIKNVYLFGSRVYGNHNENSDYDFLVVANNINTEQEYKGKLNIHIHIPDIFKRNLFEHDIHELECIFAPDFAKMQEKLVYPEFKIKPQMLYYKLMQQSFNCFKKAKLLWFDGRINECMKNIWHSYRILMFGNQIKQYGKIIDFSESNSIYHEMTNCSLNTWDEIKQKYLPGKVKLEENLEQRI